MPIRPPPPGWNPMETAPKEGPILFLVPAGLMDGIDVAVQVEWSEKRQLFKASGFPETPNLRHCIDEAIGWKVV